MTATREQHFFDHLKRLRQEHPTLDDSFWAAMAEKERLQWQVDDLREGVARLVGKYEVRVEQEPGNAQLAALVADLWALVARPEATETIEEIR
jgi:hypothetical protein